MGKNISTLVEDIFELFNPKETHKPQEENLEEFAETIKQIMRVRLGERENVKDPLRFSSLGKPDRQIWNMAQGKDQEEISSKVYFKFLFGDLIEAMLIFLAKESGHDVQDQQREVEADGILGHVDAVIDGVVIDIKSAAPYSFTKFKNGTYVEDVFSKQYLNQLCGYSNLLTPGEAPGFLVMDKVSGDLCLTMVSSSIAQDFQPLPRIKHLKEVINSAIPPERCYPDEEEGKSGNRKLGTGCSYCAFKADCWPGVRKFLYSAGPKYLTVVAKTPDVYEVQT